jgi:hypothetical protein
MSYAIVIQEGPTEIIEIGVPGLQGPAGVNGGVGSNGYSHIQAIPSTFWNITHGLNLDDLHVQVFDQVRAKVDPAIEHVSANQTLIFFNIPTSGSARII